MNHPSLLEQLYRRYLANELSAQELDQFLTLLRQAGDDEPVRQLMEGTWAELFDRGAVAPDEPAPVVPMRKRWWFRLSVAAVVCGLVAGGGYLWRLEQRRVVAPALLVVSKPGVVEKFSYRPVSYIRHLVLPDGSNVVLQANSTLIYPEKFVDSARVVVLKGEAYFDIHPDVAEPFVIWTGAVKTTVLGTAFNIKAYPQTNQVEVAVAKGRVKVEIGKKMLGVLTQDHQITYQLGAARVKEQQVNAAALVKEWTSQDMVFRSMSFGDIAQVLSQRYNATIEFKNTVMRQCTIRAEFSGTESLEQVLTGLCTILNATYTIDEGIRVVIDGKGCE